MMINVTPLVAVLGLQVLNFSLLKPLLAGTIGGLFLFACGALICEARFRKSAGLWGGAALCAFLGYLGLYIALT